MTFVGLCTDWLKKSKKSQTLRLLFMYRACHKRVKKEKEKTNANVVPNRSLSRCLDRNYFPAFAFFFLIYFFIF